MQIVFDKQHFKFKRSVRQRPQEQSQQYADAMLIQEKSFRSSKFEQHRQVPVKQQPQQHQDAGHREHDHKVSEIIAVTSTGLSS